MPRIIEVLDYDAAWPQQYEAEAKRLRPVFGSALVAIHHIGSTSVPGMRSKPTIDILVEVAPGVQIEDFYPGMSELGYECRGECLDAVVPGTPGRHYFSKKVDMQHTHHVHVCHEGHPQITELLALRDHLRGHPHAATEYGNLKTELAQRFPRDNVEYMRGKDRFIKKLIARSTVLALILVATLALGVLAEHESQPEIDLRIQGDTLGTRIVRFLAFQFGRLHSREDVFGDSDPIEAGRLDFFQKRCDIGVFHRPLTPKEVEEAKNAGVIPKESRIGFVVFAVAVHPTNPIDDISVSQLRALYSGDISNWQELGGPDAPVEVVARSDVSDHDELFVDLVMDGRDVREDITRVGPVDMPRVIVQQTPNAIGYMHFGLLDRSLKALSVDGIPPTPEMIRSGAYPLAPPICLYVDEKSERIKEAEEFIDLVLSKEAREFLEHSGIVPVEPEVVRQEPSTEKADRRGQ